MKPTSLTLSKGWFQMNPTSPTLSGRVVSSETVSLTLSEEWFQVNPTSPTLSGRVVSNETGISSEVNSPSRGRIKGQNNYFFDTAMLHGVNTCFHEKTKRCVPMSDEFFQARGKRHIKACQFPPSTKTLSYFKWTLCKQILCGRPMPFYIFSKMLEKYRHFSNILEKYNP